MISTTNHLIKDTYSSRQGDQVVYLKLTIELTKSIWILSDELHQMFSCSQIDIAEVKFNLWRCQIHLIQWEGSNTYGNQASNEWETIRKTVKAEKSEVGTAYMFPVIWGKEKKKIKKKINRIINKRRFKWCNTGN